MNEKKKVFQFNNILNPCGYAFAGAAAATPVVKSRLKDVGRTNVLLSRWVEGEGVLLCDIPHVGFKSEAGEKKDLLFLSN